MAIQSYWIMNLQMYLDRSNHRVEHHRMSMFDILAHHASDLVSSLEHAHGKQGREPRIA